jgi:hypothetical protein
MLSILAQVSVKDATATADAILADPSRYGYY